MVVRAMTKPASVHPHCGGTSRTIGKSCPGRPIHIEVGQDLTRHGRSSDDIRGCAAATRLREHRQVPREHSEFLDLVQSVEHSYELSSRSPSGYQPSVELCPLYYSEHPGISDISGTSCINVVEVDKESTSLCVLTPQHRLASVGTVDQALDVSHRSAVRVVEGDHVQRTRTAQVGIEHADPGSWLRSDRRQHATSRPPVCTEWPNVIGHVITRYISGLQ